MTSVFNVALSGLQRHSRAVHVAAHNVANVNTDGYRSVRYDGATDGVTTRNAMGPDVVDADGNVPSGVDLASEFVEIKRAEIGYRANAAVLRVADRLTGELLDVLG